MSAIASVLPFECPRCGTKSWHPEDLRNGFCGRCRWWTGDEILGSPDVIAAAERDGALERLPSPPVPQASVLWATASSVLCALRRAVRR